MQPVAETLKAQLSDEETTLVRLENELLELQARAADQRETVRRLSLACDALDGKDLRDSSVGPERAAHNREVAGSNPAPATKPPAEPDNPLAHLKCKGCGRTGTMRQHLLQSPSGMPVNMLTCGDCGNQLPLGL